MSTRVMWKSLDVESRISFSDDRVYSGEPKRITEKSLLYFSGGDKSNPNFPQKTIHTCMELAEKCGLGKRVASGAMSEGYIAELMIDVVGKAWLKYGKMRVKFIQTVTIGDIITAHALFQEVDGDKAVFKVWCSNQHKVKTVIGQAII